MRPWAYGCALENYIVESESRFVSQAIRGLPSSPLLLHCVQCAVRGLSLAQARREIDEVGIDCGDSVRGLGFVTFDDKTCG